MTVYCATSNKGKLREFQLAAPDFDVQQLPRPVPAPDETGATFEENAIGKAEYYGGFIDGYLFADDSGLEVDALGGAPGVHSARYAGDQQDSDANIRKLLEALADVPDARRAARFRCVIVVARPDGATLVTEGTCEGRITRVPRGRHGFGYDPVFLHPPSGHTFAELSAAVKNHISHRARACRQLRPQLAGFLADSGGPS